MPGLAVGQVEAGTDLGVLMPGAGVDAASHVVAAEARGGWIAGDHLGEIGGRHFAQDDLRDGDELAARVLDDAEELAFPRGLCSAKRAHFGTELLARLRLARLFDDLFDDALGNRVVNRDAVEARTLGIVTLGRGDHLGPRRVLGAVDFVGRDGFELIAPHNAGHGHVDELARIFVQIDFV